MIPLLKLIGIIGLLLIITGVSISKRKTRNIFLLFGGLALEAYSIYINDLIFIILQGIFVVTVVWNMVKK